MRMRNSRSQVVSGVYQQTLWLDTTHLEIYEITRQDVYHSLYPLSGHMWHETADHDVEIAFT